MTIALTACAGGDKPDKSITPNYPDYWGRYYSAGDGLIAVTGYFTPEQIKEKSLFNHLSTNVPVGCKGQTPVRYDVRWIAVPAPDAKRCAMVIYSFTCAADAPRRGSSLEYERKQALLDEPPHPVEKDCGQGRRSPIPPPEHNELLALSEIERKLTFPGTECAGG